MRQILIASAIALALNQPLYAIASSSPGIPVKDGQQTGLIKEAERGGETLGVGNAWQALAQGRQVYRDLLRAQRAAADHNEMYTRMALYDASQVLDTFDEPGAARALRQQLGIIREDLVSEGMKPHAGLWLPLEAELDEALVTALTDHQQRAKAAVREGLSLTAKGDRSSALQRLNLLEAVLDYRWGLLPLNRIRADVHSAEMALDPDPPYWKGINESVQSALDAVQWVTTTDATGWFSAYDEVVHARQQLPEQPQLARANLERAGKDLDGLKDATALAKQAHRLATQSQPTGKAVDSLLSDLRAGIAP